MASLSPSPVMVLTPVLGEAATTSWPPWRRMATVFEPIRPVPPMTTIFMIYLPCRRLESPCATLQRDEIQNTVCSFGGGHKAGEAAHTSILRCRGRQNHEGEHSGSSGIHQLLRMRYRSDVDNASIKSGSS